MKTRMILTAAVVGLVGASLSAGSSVSGKYVEARTAEVFTGGCIMGREDETVGKQAGLAWKVDRGSYNGISLDGLSVVAAVAGDRNLGIREIGGGKANTRRSGLRAAPPKGSVRTVVSVTSTPIQFTDQDHSVHVAAGQVALDVSKHIPHDPTGGAMQWFHPLSSIADATIGIADQHSFSGTGLGTKWSDPNNRS